LNKKYADAHYNKAVALKNLGRSAGAVSEYEALIQCAPTDDRELCLAKERLQILAYQYCLKCLREFIVKFAVL